MRRREKLDAAYQLYKQGERLSAIAHKLDVPEGTVRRWKHDYKWANDTETERSQNTERVRTFGSELSPDMLETLRNSALSEKERLFCIFYVQCFNGAKAARLAGYSPNRDRQTAHDLLNRPAVREEVERLKLGKVSLALFNEEDIFERMLAIAFADIGDVVSFNGSSLKLKPSSAIDTSVISEIRNGPTGISVKLLDKMRALEWLYKYLTSSGAPDEDVNTLLEEIKRYANADQQTADQ